jgi:hypothetical protein
MSNGTQGRASTTGKDLQEPKDRTGNLLIVSGLVLVGGAIVVFAVAGFSWIGVGLAVLGVCLVLYGLYHKAKRGVAAALGRVKQLDFSKLNKKLQYDDPKYWTDERIVQAEEAYRKFLALNLLYPGVTLAVNRMLDDYWHAHILDTANYAADCKRVFGSFLHHYPYFGLPGEADEGENVPAFAVTKRIWEEAFGTPLVGETKAVAGSRLTLDRVLSGLERADDGPDAGPKGCKNGQHCSKVIAPIEIDDSFPFPAVPTTAIRP